MPKWVWEEFDPSRTSTSGDISKLFRNEPVKGPGVFALDPPPPNATVMAREVIQNSWDAALEAQAHSTSPPDFELQFDFKTASEPDRGNLIAALALDQLAQRVHNYETQAGKGLRKDLGLADPLCLDELDSPSYSLPYLVISETGTTGMYGSWENGESRMYLALATLGWTPKREGGGAYGYGKAGLIRGSATRTVIAYTCFPERSDDPGVTRRLFGMTYWGDHQIQTSRYTGFARFGDEASDGNIVPFEDQKADEVAASLGLSHRSPERRDELGTGTTFLLLQPLVQAEGLKRAVERYWWPALEDPSIEFSVTIRQPNGQVLHPRPRRDPVLRSFIEAYETATVSQDNTHPHKRVHKLQTISDFSSPGTLGLVANPDDWSYPHQTQTDMSTPTDHRSLVALMRKPRMVVEYWDAGRTTPFVRGTFVADDSIDDALRDTEPKSHDAWQTKADDDSDTSNTAANYEAARKLLDRIKRHVNKLREDLKPSPRPQEQVRLPEFDRIMAKIMRGAGSGTSGPVPEPRPVTIHLTPMAEPVDDRQVRVTGQAEFALSDNYEGDCSESLIRLRYLFDEDGRSGDRVELEINAPEGFDATEDPGNFIGMLHRDSPATFEFASDPHLALWAGRVSAEVDLLPSEPITSE
ncbi:MAG: hypothetical protein OXF04_09490 [bacterium]|nr:hypothetical protein [bacterium]